MKSRGSTSPTEAERLGSGHALHGLLMSVRRLETRQALLTWALVFASAACAAVALYRPLVIGFELPRRAQLAPTMHEQTFVVLTGLILTALLLGGLLRVSVARRSLDELASDIDRRAELEDLLRSAWEIQADASNRTGRRQTEEQLRVLLLARAERRAASLVPSQVAAPKSYPQALRVLLSLAAVAGGSLLLPPPHRDSLPSFGLAPAPSLGDEAATLDGALEVEGALPQPTEDRLDAMAISEAAAPTSGSDLDPATESETRNGGKAGSGSGRGEGESEGASDSEGRRGDDRHDGEEKRTDRDRAAAEVGDEALLGEQRQSLAAPDRQGRAQEKLAEARQADDALDKTPGDGPVTDSAQEGGQGAEAAAALSDAAAASAASKGSEPATAAGSPGGASGVQVGEVETLGEATARALEIEMALIPTLTDSTESEEEPLRLYTAQETLEVPFAGVQGLDRYEAGSGAVPPPIPWRHRQAVRHFFWRTPEADTTDKDSPNRGDEP